MGADRGLPLHFKSIAHYPRANSNRSRPTANDINGLIQLFLSLQDWCSDAAKIMTMARYVARRTVKNHLLAKGIKPQTLEPMELNKLIDALLIAKRTELIAEAKARLGVYLEIR
jgi:hypothetical protein